MELTEQEMRAALFARYCDSHPNFANGELAAAETAEVWYDQEGKADKATTRREKEEAVNRYRKGKEILSRYTLRYSDRTTVHTMADGSIPGEEEGDSALRIEAGHIGTAVAYTTAIFKKK